MARAKSASAAGRVWGAAWRSVAVFLVLGIVALVVSVGITMASLPSFAELMKSPQGQAVRLVSADGKLLVNQGPSYGGWLEYEETPPVMVGAMLAVEDRRFFSHPGIDPKGLARAIYVSLRDDERPKATSTITQQLARNLFLTNERTLSRKAHEALLALAMERKFTKEEILELYLNRVYFGGGAYGVDAASRRFYGHSASQLSPAEAAIIAGLVKAPSRFAPSSDPEKARTRAGVVALTMERDGIIADAAEVRQEIADLEFAPQPNQNNVRYFTDWVLQHLDGLTDETVEPLIVTTTLIWDMQQAAEKTIEGQTPAAVQGALVSMTNDGAVRAMMGGRDYVSSNYNRATVAERQPGSAWKLFVYLSAIENGVVPNDYISDTPVTIDGWTPRNYGRGYRGTVSVKEAFASSLNTAAAQLGQRVGYNNVAMMARRLGIETDISRRPAMTLGTSTVRLLEMTAAYAAVANGGSAVDPYGILRIETASGRVIYEREPRARRVVLAPWVATNMTHLLEAVVTSGTGRAAAFGKPAAGKTGTTSNYQDGYFVGFTADLTTGIWMGRDDNRPVKGLTGGSSPARAFASYMAAATRGMPARPLNSDIGTDDDFFAEPDMEVYGIDAEWEGDWDGRQEDGYYGDYSARGDRPYYAEPYDRRAGTRRNEEYARPWREDYGDRQNYRRQEDYRRGPASDLRAADVPTRPRASGDSSSSWLDEPVREARRTPRTSEPPPVREVTPPQPPASPPAPPPVAGDGPTQLLPPDPMQ